MSNNRLPVVPTVTVLAMIKTRLIGATKGHALLKKKVTVLRHSLCVRTNRQVVWRSRAEYKCYLVTGQLERRSPPGLALADLMARVLLRHSPGGLFSAPGTGLWRRFACCSYVRNRLGHCTLMPRITGIPRGWEHE
jgi:hypothetical protein